VQQGREPDLTFWFDVDVTVAAQRRAAARDPDRLEQLDAAFFERVRDGYRARLSGAPQRMVRVDAALAPPQVWRQVEHEVARRGWW
jgi:dTMP kinase